MINLRITPARPDGSPVIIPSWLSSPDKIGPCPCGQPIQVGQPYTIMQGEYYKRYFHIPCAQLMMMETGESDDQ